MSDDPVRNLGLSALDAKAQVDDLLKPTETTDDKLIEVMADALENVSAHTDGESHD